MDDTGKTACFLQIFRFIAVSFGCKPIASCSFQYIFCTGTVTGYAAIEANLLQWNPLSIVGKYHGKTCCTAFQSLHLHDYRNLRHPFCDRLFYFFLSTHYGHLNLLQMT